MLKRIFILAAFAAFHVLTASAVNPITPEGRYFSDPAGRVGPDGALYLFGSRDECTNWYCSCGNDVMKTTDLVNWELTENILRSRAPDDGVNETDTVLFAPDGICIDGRWYLMFCTPDTNYVEGVACADSPLGPFTGAKRIPECTQIDPSIWRDDDGTLYYTWGQFSMKMAKFLPDMSGVDASTIKDGVIDEKHHNFHEGSQIFKRNNIWYLVFADIGRRHRPTSIGYATAESPFGPYTYRGVIIDNFGCDPEVWNNHGSVVEYKGRWYVFYHRSTNASVMYRKACAEEIKFDDDGLIREVEMTSSGVGPDLDPFSETEARFACLMDGNIRIVTGPDGGERLAAIEDGDSATWRYFEFPKKGEYLVMKLIAHAGGEVVLKGTCGERYGRVKVPAGDGVTMHEVRMRLMKPFHLGRAGVILEFSGDDDGTLMELESFKFE